MIRPEQHNECLFNTPRLVCRRWRNSDLDALYQVYSDPLAMQWVGDRKPISLPECHNWLHVTARNYATRGYGMFTLEEQTSGQIAGFCGLVHPGNQPQAEIKYALRRNLWGQGLASEFVPALLNHGAQVHGLELIIATVYPQNLASRRVLEKAGMLLVREFDDDGHTICLYEWHA
ncbi:GNAT family N-acetyltransferase [Bowmanella denitrificans]|uniref:GNAT family N-acetyltransferase n=1 Tax=Bowmanella denitrificans TaxID=366582 RepID=A0ABN0X7Y3_9ALTE